MTPTPIDLPEISAPTQDNVVSQPETDLPDIPIDPAQPTDSDDLPRITRTSNHPK